MRIVDLDLDNLTMANFIWDIKEAHSGYYANKKWWSLRFKDCKREIGKITYITLNQKTGEGIYEGKVTVDKLSGDFKFKEDDLEVAKFKVFIKVVEKLKELKRDPKKMYYELY
jgi:hypothetical protein